MVKEMIISQLQQHHMQNAWVMLYCYDQVVIGKYENETLKMPAIVNEEYCYEIHCFNQDKELRCGKNQQFICIEDSKDPLYIMKESCFILGNQGRVTDGFTELMQYGRKVTLPVEIQVKNASHQWRLVVHHQFDENDGHLCGYRLVDLCEGGE